MTKKKTIKQVQTDFYKRMLAAKKAKADKLQRETMKPLDEAPKVRPELPNTPKRIEVTEPTYGKMEENTSTSSAIEKALQRIEQQAKGL